MHTSWRTTVHTLHTSWCTTTVYTIWRVTQTDLRTTSCHSLPPSYIGSGLIHRTHLHYSTGCALLLCVFCEIKLILNIIWYWYWHCTSIWMKNWPYVYMMYTCGSIACNGNCAALAKRLWMIVQSSTTTSAFARVPFYSPQSINSFISSLIYFLQPFENMSSEIKPQITFTCKTNLKYFCIFLNPTMFWPFPPLFFVEDCYVLFSIAFLWYNLIFRFLFYEFHSLTLMPDLLKC